MAVVRGVVLAVEGKRVKVLTDEGEFKVYRRSNPPEVGEEFEKLEIGDYLAYTIAAAIIFGLAVLGFKLLTGGF